jgi:EpsI family protein
MISARTLVVLAMMSATAVLLRVRGDVDNTPSSRPLSELPETIGGRTATDYPLDDEVLQVLGKGVFLNRVYAEPPYLVPASLSDRIPVGLFIGYFPTQRTGQSIHSPQNCLPGAGWVFETSGVTTLTDAAGKKYQVGEYLISNGSTKQEVLYWYRVHGRSVASDYIAKLDTLIDSIRYNRTDAALVRVITVVPPGEDREEARARAISFADKLAPLLPAYIPD